MGPSGAGKSTLARCAALLEAPDSGAVLYDGRDLLRIGGHELGIRRRRIQLVFQDAAGALNPRLTASEILEEPLRIARVPPAERRRRVAAVTEAVGLDVDGLGRRPLDFSGGQRQRLVIARALGADPEVLILDEAFSGLDLSVQARIANLLTGLQERLGLAFLCISHDLRMVRHLADELAVLVGGRIVERGPLGRLLDDPRHPFTRRLVAADAAAAVR